MTRKNPNLWLTPEQRWVVFKAFIKETGLVKQHINSYNRFVQEEIHKIVSDIGKIELGPSFKVEIRDVRIEEPTIKEVVGVSLKITPMDARIRNLAYSAPMKATIVVYDNGTEVRREEIDLGKLPVMLRSVLDPMSKMSEEELLETGEDRGDPGGYFIIKGSERVLVTQEDLAPNRIFVDKAKEGTNITHTAKVISAKAGFRVPVHLDRLKNGTLKLNFPPLSAKVPFAVMMKALGLTTDKEIVLAVSTDPAIMNELRPSLEEARAIKTQEEALEYIGSRILIGSPKEIRIQRARQNINNFFLPHLGTDESSWRRKALFLGQMANKLLELALGRRDPDDKDHYANRRLRLSGDLLSQLFRAVFKQYMKSLRDTITKYKVRGRPSKLSAYTRPDLITERIRHALSTGNWVGGRTGVSQILDRVNWISMLSHLRRTIAPLSRGQPHFEARDLHPTQWGRICPFETPEGPNCGLVKNLALSSYISVGVDEETVLPIIFSMGVVPVEQIYERLLKDDVQLMMSLTKMTKVFLNGTLIGYYLSEDATDFVEKLRKLRREGKIHYEVSISYLRKKYTAINPLGIEEERVLNEVYINTDSGRVMRPLFVVENGKLKITPDVIEKLKRGELKFFDLVRMGYIELLDAEEEENAYIAINPEDITPEHTHLEIWPPGIFGVAAATIPYLEHNQSPRNAYQSAMAKQALGLYAANYNLRFDSRAHILHYPQKPIVQTKFLDIIGYNKRPAGQNFVVAVLSLTGYNMEDAIIVSKTSVERGLARSTFLKEYTTEVAKYHGEKVGEPPMSAHGFRGKQKYRLLDMDGIISPEVEVKAGDVLVGKISPPRFVEESEVLGVGAPTAKVRDTSLAIRHGEKGVVDTVVLTISEEGNPLIRVRVRDLRIPEIGDKFASRHGQKGVIGLLIPQYDMPYTPDGITPDLIINPHALPSRMTVGQLIETIAGKAGALSGRLIDGTPYFGENVNDLGKELLLHGYPADGTEPMYDGRTGELLMTPIFIGIVYYQRLHHMVADKIHARARGPVQILTRQPTEGRAREGGLRIGEMERDCMVGHGAPMLLLERMLKSSDETTIYVCELCGMIGWYNRNKKRLECPIHGDKGRLYPVRVSYAFKLLLQELMSMCIYPRLILRDKYRPRTSVGGGK